MVKNGVVVALLALSLLGCNVPRAMMNGSYLSTDCAISDRYCRVPFKSITRAYPNVSPQQAVNAVQQVWIEQGYDVRGLALTQKQVTGTRNGKPTPVTIYDYGKAVRYYPENGKDCWWQQAYVGISQDATNPHEPSTVQVVFRVRQCGDSLESQYGANVTPEERQFYQKYDGFFRSQKDARYADEFHALLAKKLQVRSMDPY